MASLSEVYERGVGSVQSSRRVYLGAGLLAVGSFAVLAGIVVATTGVPPGFDTLESRHLAGTLAGLGVPVALVGILTVLPTTREVRGIAAAGTVICLYGVVRFRNAYPHHWDGYGADLTFLVTAIYSLGTLLALAAVFVGLITLKLRNDPGGTVSLEVVRDGETRVIEVDRSAIDDDSAVFGGVGTIGERPDGEVETQTNRPERTAREGQRSARGRRSGGGSHNPQQRRSTASAADRRRRRTDRSTKNRPPGTRPASDGGGTAAESSTRSQNTPPGVGLDDHGDGVEPHPTDRYCGNCTHFEYVNRGQGLRPFCALHGTQMTDMDACDRWTSNR